MFDVKPDPRMTDTDKLLYNIWQELKVLSAQYKQESKEEQESPVSAEPPKQNKVCKYCGQPHEKPVEYLQCAKKHKT
jgi:hypothetical protein